MQHILIFYAYTYSLHCLYSSSLYTSSSFVCVCFCVCVLESRSTSNSERMDSGCLTTLLLLVTKHNVFDQTQIRVHSDCVIVQVTKQYALIRPTSV